MSFSILLIAVTEEAEPLTVVSVGRPDGADNKQKPAEWNPSIPHVVWILKSDPKAAADGKLLHSSSEWCFLTPLLLQVRTRCTYRPHLFTCDSQNTHRQSEDMTAPVCVCVCVVTVWAVVLELHICICTTQRRLTGRRIKNQISVNEVNLRSVPDVENMTDVSWTWTLHAAAESSD